MQRVIFQKIITVFLCPIRGHPLSTYAPRGGGVKKSGKYAYDSTDRLREKRTRGGEGVKKAGKSAYVLYGCSLIENVTQFTNGLG